MTLGSRELVQSAVGCREVTPGRRDVGLVCKVMAPGFREMVLGHRKVAFGNKEVAHVTVAWSWGAGTWHWGAGR